ncbi:ATP-binding protein [Sphaerisporangium sp. TRM90804]|uniref:ATP-binding protein n=1 Tax=Sphaerisporangium sp. TRM90804 TaxID=3031113 RepID=UPI00244B9CCD|nr:ATP-binding protein [Sphaerisporangium sp. TRM90804]MDH2428741.1 ATP-binding protein [Sphaerisporangium sp. TRM90804]
MAPDTFRELRLPSNPECAARARAEVSDWLGQDHPAYEHVRLAVSELVTNAVKHAHHDVAAAPPHEAPRETTPHAPQGPGLNAPHGAALDTTFSAPLTLRLSTQDDRLRVEVTDTGLTADHPHIRMDPAFLVTQDGRDLAILLPEGGRGLAIVDLLSNGHWGSHPNPHGPGQTVWCTLPADPPPERLDPDLTGSDAVALF